MLDNCNKDKMTSALACFIAKKGRTAGLQRSWRIGLDAAPNSCSILYTIQL